VIAQRRHTSVVWPLILIVGGAVLLLANAGFAPEGSAWRLLDLWPLILVMVGVQLVVSRLFAGQTAAAIGLVAVGVIAVAAFAYAIAGPSLSGASERFTSSSSAQGVTAGTLTVDAAGGDVTIVARDTGDMLYQATVDYSGTRPRLTSVGGDVHLSSGRFSGFSWNAKADTTTVAVNPAVPWTVVINGAGANTSISLPDGLLRSVSINAAGGRSRLALGVPSGTVPIHIAGVGTDTTLVFAPAAQYRVQVQGLSANASGPRATAGWEAATDRYDVDVSGLAAKVAVEVP